MAGYRSVSVELGALCVRRSPIAKRVLRSGFAFPALVPFPWLSSPDWPEDATVAPLPAQGSSRIPSQPGHWEHVPLTLLSKPPIFTPAFGEQPPSSPDVFRLSARTMKTSNWVKNAAQAARAGTVLGMLGTEVA